MKMLKYLFYLVFVLVCFSACKHQTIDNTFNAYELNWIDYRGDSLTYLVHHSDIIIDTIMMYGDSITVLNEYVEEISSALRPEIKVYQDGSAIFDFTETGFIDSVKVSISKYNVFNLDSIVVFSGDFEEIEYFDTDVEPTESYAGKFADVYKFIVIPDDSVVQYSDSAWLRSFYFGYENGVVRIELTDGRKIELID